MDVINYARSSHVCAATKHMGGGFFSKWGAQVHVKKTIENFCGLNWQLQGHKHCNITSLPMNNMNYEDRNSELGTSELLWRANFPVAIGGAQLLYRAITILQLFATLA